MNEDINNILRDLGLSEKEIKVYIALLKLGPSPVSKITEHSEVNRVTVYPTLKNLIEKGFVSKFLMERKNHFKAIEPKQILNLIKEKENKIKDIVPILEQISKKIKTSTSIELFRGSKGISSFIEKIYSSGEKEMFAYGNFDVAARVIEYQSLYARKLRLRKKIKLNIIVNPLKEYPYEDPRYKKITTLKFNKKLKNLNVYIIFGKKIVGILELTQELIAIIIENEEIAKYHKFVYDLLNKS